MCCITCSMTSSSATEFSSIRMKISTLSSFTTFALDWSQRNSRTLSTTSWSLTKKMKLQICTSSKREWSELDTTWCPRDSARSNSLLALSASKTQRYADTMSASTRSQSSSTLQLLMLRQFLWARGSLEVKSSKSTQKLQVKLWKVPKTGTWRTLRMCWWTKDSSTWKRSISRVDIKHSTLRIRAMMKIRSNLAWVVRRISMDQTFSTTSSWDKTIAATSVLTLTLQREALSPAAWS